MFFGHVRPCKCKLHCDTLIFIKKTIIVNDYARCHILILLQTLILCGKMNEWTHYLLHIYIYTSSSFFCSLFTRLKTVAMELELVQQSEKEKKGFRVQQKEKGKKRTFRNKWQARKEEVSR